MTEQMTWQGAHSRNDDLMMCTWQNWWLDDVHIAEQMTWWCALRRTDDLVMCTWQNWWLDDVHMTELMTWWCAHSRTDDLHIAEEATKTFENQIISQRKHVKYENVD